MDSEWTCFPNLCAVSHIGARKNNEDGFIVENLHDGYYVGIADGMGGHPAGEVASAMAINEAKESVIREYKPGMGAEALKFLLRESHEDANAVVVSNAVGDREGMGTTLLTAIIRAGEVIMANTGDSRATLIRDGKILYSTRDHSLVQKLLDEGEITEQEAWGHPASNRLVHVIGGSGKRFAVDLYHWKTMPGDTLIMSTDGLHDYLKPEKVIEIVANAKDPRRAVEALLEAALPETRDNVTIILYRW